MLLIVPFNPFNPFTHTFFQSFFTALLSKSSPEFVLGQEATRGALKCLSMNESQIFNTNISFKLILNFKL
jgi:hypothetical protein